MEARRTQLVTHSNLPQLSRKSSNDEKSYSNGLGNSLATNSEILKQINSHSVI